MEVQEFIEFNGATYKLMGGKRKYYLSQSSTNKGRKNPKGLHVAIWEYVNGKEVPAGWHVHHKDGDTFNNNPSNLEAISALEHHRIPKKIDREKMLANLDEIRPLAAKWHGSKEGIEWHKKHGKESWEGRKKHEITCVECKGTHLTFFPNRTRFCSNACAMRAYRRNNPEIIKRIKTKKKRLQSHS